VRGTADWMFRMVSPGLQESTLAAFNVALPETAERELLTCCASESFARAIAEGRPYREPAALQDAVYRTDTLRRYRNVECDRPITRQIRR